MPSALAGLFSAVAAYLFNNPGQNTLRQAQGAHPEPVEGCLPLLFEKIRSGYKILAHRQVTGTPILVGDGGTPPGSGVCFFHNIFIAKDVGAAASVMGRCRWLGTHRSTRSTSGRANRL